MAVKRNDPANASPRGGVSIGLAVFVGTLAGFSSWRSCSNTAEISSLTEAAKEADAKADASAIALAHASTEIGALRAMILDSERTPGISDGHETRSAPPLQREELEASVVQSRVVTIEAPRDNAAPRDEVAAVPGGAGTTSSGGAGSPSHTGTSG
jgi:hypothetical protein